jgi:hypothetical protein
MRIYHPKHGILHVSNQAEIKRLLETGGEEFDVHNKPWQRKAKVEEVVEVEQALTIHTTKRGRPYKHGHN